MEERAQHSLGQARLSRERCDAVRDMLVTIMANPLEFENTGIQQAPEIEDRIRVGGTVLVGESFIHEQV